MEIYKKKSESFYVREGTSDKVVVDECFGTVYFKSFIKYSNTDIVFDVGANIGAYSTRVSPLVKEVFSYEPDKENFALSEKNIELNLRANVNLNNFALIANNMPQISFFINNKKNKGSHSVVGKRGRTEVTVDAKKFSEQLKEKRPTIVKIDIEGAEYDIFMNNNIDWSSVNTLMMEWHQAHLLDKDQSKFNDVVNYLQKHFDKVIAPVPTKKAWCSIMYAFKEQKG